MAPRIPLIVLAVGWALSACGPYRHEQPAPQDSATSVLEPERTRRGNPPFYTVMGKRYYVSGSSEGYRQTGVASWYGQKFHGLPTASGEIYDMHKLTAAHKTLPIPTWVEVTNLSNGESVIVKVNDRGPFIDNRLIDLSYGAAQAVGMVRAGTSLVQVRALGASAASTPRGTARTAEPKAQTAAQPTTPAAAPRESLYVQVGAFGDQSNAQRVVTTLETAGLSDVFMVSLTDLTPTLHRVRIGPIDTVARYDALLGQLAELGFGNARLVTIN